MKIGIPREIKVLEGRVALIPAAAGELVALGHSVYVETHAGEQSGYTDQDYQAVGVQIVDTAAALYAGAELVVKVKEPQPEELAYLRPDHLLFSYLHLAAAPELTQALCNIGLTAVAFETVAVGCRLPLLAPMSEVAGRIAVQIGAHLLHRPQGGEGLLLGGVAGTERGKVVILGGGTAGSASAQVASALGAEVVVFDPNRDKQAALQAIGRNVTARHPFAADIAAAVKQADLLIGAVLIPGAKAPHLVNAALVRQMKSGSVIIDISVDQGGCIETTRPTTYADPTYVWEGIIHFGVTNMPGAVPRTSSQALSAAITPYVHRLTQAGWQQAEDLAEGINIQAGKIMLSTLLQR